MKFNLSYFFVQSKTTCRPWTNNTNNISLIKSFHELSILQFVSRRLDVHKESSSIYVTLGFAGLALVAAMLVGVIVLKRRQGKHPHLQVRIFF